jgi:hypothetical protein
MTIQAATRGCWLPVAINSRLSWGGLVFGLALLSACSSSPGIGPFGNGGTPGAECVPVSSGGVITYGFEEFHNSGGPAQIESVSLVSPHDLRVLAAWAVPITGHTLYGVWGGYPAPGDLSPGVQWADRQHADGAVIRHSDGSDVTNLVLVLKPDGRKGTASALEVLYESGGKQYEMTMPTSIEVIVAKSCPA